MAIHVYCDDPSHDADKFTPAIARVRVTTLKNNTIETARTWDSCVDHLGIFASLGWDMEPVTENFHRVTIEKIAGVDDA